MHQQRDLPRHRRYEQQLQPRCAAAVDVDMARIRTRGRLGAARTEVHAGPPGAAGAVVPAAAAAARSHAAAAANAVQGALLLARLGSPWDDDVFLDWTSDVMDITVRQRPAMLPEPAAYAKMKFVLDA